MGGVERKALPGKGAFDRLMLTAAVLALVHWPDLRRRRTVLDRYLASEPDDAA